MATKKEIKTEKKELKTAKAKVTYLRISPRKVRCVISNIRRKPVHQAFAILASIKQKSARLTEKLLKSGVANAKDLGLQEDKLYVSTIFADGGPTLKRFRPRSMGRADRILKKTTHISIVLAEGTKVYKRAAGQASVPAELGQDESGAALSGKKKTSKKTKKAAASKA